MIRTDQVACRGPFRNDALCCAESAPTTPGVSIDPHALAWGFGFLQVFPSLRYGRSSQRSEGNANTLPSGDDAAAKSRVGVSVNSTRWEPSGATVKRSPASLTTAIRSVGPHAGKLAANGRTSRAKLDPSGATMEIVPPITLVMRLETNAIRVPSGDHAGHVSSSGPV
jgi:hypothetical protein